MWFKIIMINNDEIVDEVNMKEIDHEFLLKLTILLLMLEELKGYCLDYIQQYFLM